jgi:hypothetical protein
MSPQEVVAVLGEPDRIAVFEGKYLRDVPLAAAATSNPDGRFVFIYREGNLNVWFAHGLATGLTKRRGPGIEPDGGHQAQVNVVPPRPCRSLLLG